MLGSACFADAIPYGLARWLMVGFVCRIETA
jgi:hypothetical protein